MRRWSSWTRLQGEFEKKYIGELVPSHQLSVDVLTRVI